MANAQISGLVSGLDTASIISQLMKLEAQPQTRLRIKLNQEQSNIGSLQGLNAKFAALVTEAKQLAAPTGWSPVTATSSHPQVSVTGGEGALAGTLHLTVDQVATGHQVSFAPTADSTIVVGGSAHTVRIDYQDGTTKDIDTGDGTLRGLVAALNAADTGLRATTVRLDDGTLRLQVSSATTGVASDFALTAVQDDGSLAQLGIAGSVSAGRDAKITVGSDQVSSPSNTFTQLSGLSITLGTGVPVGTPVELTVAQDTSSLKTAVKSLVDNMNAAITSADALSTYDPATKTSGALYGDSAVRAARTDLARTIYPAGGGSLAGLGIQVDRYGKLTFDQAAFDKAYAADPAAVRDAFVDGASPGFASRVAAVATSVSDAATGTMTSVIKSHDKTVTEYREGIEDWDRRLAMRKAGLERQFSTLETALNQLQRQGDWLAGQLNSLNSNS